MPVSPNILIEWVTFLASPPLLPVPLRAQLKYYRSQPCPLHDEGQIGSSCMHWKVSVTLGSEI